MIIFSKKFICIRMCWAISRIAVKQSGVFTWKAIMWKCFINWVQYKCSVWWMAFHCFLKSNTFFGVSSFFLTLFSFSLFLLPCYSSPFFFFLSWSSLWYLIASIDTSFLGVSGLKKVTSHLDHIKNRHPIHT